MRFLTTDTEEVLKSLCLAEVGAMLLHNNDDDNNNNNNNNNSIQKAV